MRESLNYSSGNVKISRVAKRDDDGEQSARVSHVKVTRLRFETGMDGVDDLAELQSFHLSWAHLAQESGHLELRYQSSYNKHECLSHEAFCTSQPVSDHYVQQPRTWNWAKYFTVYCNVFSRSPVTKIIKSTKSMQLLSGPFVSLCLRNSIAIY